VQPDQYGEHAQAVLAKDVRAIRLSRSSPPRRSRPIGRHSSGCDVANAPSDPKVKTVWTAVDVGDAAPANTQIDEAEVTLDASGKTHFTLSVPNSGAWPAGKYKVEIYLNDKLDRTLEYTITQ
jgi:hypothetical protein